MSSSPSIRADDLVARSRPRRASRRGGRIFLVAILFLISLCIPVIFQVGPLRLSPYRLVLLFAIIPLLLMWLTRRVGPIRPPDLTLLLFCLWCALSFTTLHGVTVGLEAGGILFIETMGAYLLGRICIRSADDFRRFARILCWIILALLPFALYESLTTTNLLLRLANVVAPSFDVVPKEPRLGLDRAQGPFEHPILFGVFCGAGVALSYYVLGYGAAFLQRIARTAAVVLTSGLALSSGPLAAILTQCLLIGWDVVLKPIKARWTILAVGFASWWALVEAVANRSAAEIFIAYFAFSPWTAYNRLRIWEFGSASVLNNPVFGIGFNDWARPYWMSSSIDMFWLLPAVRHGLAAGLLLQATVVLIFIGLAFTPMRDLRLKSYRLGFQICLVGFYVAGWTVHYWNAIYVLFIFFLGSGVWMLDARSRGESRGSIDNTRSASASTFVQDHPPAPVPMSAPQRLHPEAGGQGDIDPAGLK